MKALFALAFALSAAALAVAFVAPFPSLAPASTLESTTTAAPQPREAPPPPTSATETVHVVDLAPIVIVGRRSTPRLGTAAHPSPLEQEAPTPSPAGELACAAWRPLEMGAGSVRDCIVRP